MSLVAAVPWSWFLLRDAAVGLEWVAILLPLVVTAGVTLLLLIGLVRRSSEAVVVAASLAVVGVVAVVAPWTPTGSGQPESPIRVVAANIRGDNAEHEAAGKDLLAAGADVLVLSEVTPRHDPLVAMLDGRYAHRIGGRYDEVRVWSDYPLSGSVLGAELSGGNGAAVVVAAPRIRFLLYALHLFPPSPYARDDRVTVTEQHELVRRLAAGLDGADLPVVVAGDLNLTDRGAAFRRVAAGRRDALRSRWAAPTSFRMRNRPLLLRIDHILVPGRWCADDPRRISVTGSDHAAVGATIGPCLA